MKLIYPASKNQNFQILPDTIGVPHPYCITPRHIEVASNKFSGMLSKEAIEYGEKHSNAHCGVPGCQLSYAEHEQAAVVECRADPKDHKDEIQDYFKDHGPSLEAEGVAGMALLDKFSDVLKNEENDNASS